MLKPRWFQSESVDAVLDYYLRGGTGNPLVVLPGGSGKSLGQALFMQRVLSYWSNQRFLCLTHVKELVAQNCADMLELWPTAPIGIYSAGLNQRITHAPIVYGGVGSVVNNIAAFGHRDVLQVDEAHWMSGEDESMYGEVIAGLKKINPYLKIVGWTATDYRQGGGRLTEGKIFTDVVYNMATLEGFNRLISEGYLCTLRPKQTAVEIDTTQVSTSKGDFNLRELQAASDIQSITEGAVHEIVQQGYHKHCWLTFTSGIDHAIHVNDRIKSYGVTSTTVHGKMTENERDEAFAGHLSGKYRSLVCFGMATTGYNNKPIDLIGMLRSTKSTALWVQMLSRETRPVYAPGYDLETIDGRLAAIANGQKPFGLVLDFAGNTKRLGPINDPVIPTKRGQRGGGVVPIKICPKCGFYNHTSVRMCINCLHIFEAPPKISIHAGTDELIRTEAPSRIETFTVHHMSYVKAQKAGSDKPYIRASYLCGAMGVHKFDENVILEHASPQRVRGREWWRNRYLGDGTMRNPSSFAGYVPETVQEALNLTNRLRQPKQIRVDMSSQYPQIVGYTW